MFKKMTKTVVTALMVGAMLITNVVTAQAADVSVTIEDLFDAEYYAEQNPDVANVYGADAEALLKHYLEYGIKEGRQFSKAFDVGLYKELYSDLEKEFGVDWELYVRHYLSFGIKEDRDGGGEFDIVTYIKNNPDVVDNVGLDFSALKTHYDTIGKFENRVAISPAKAETISDIDSKVPVVTNTVVEDELTDSIIIVESEEEIKDITNSSDDSEVVNIITVLHTDGAYYNYTNYMSDVLTWYDNEPKVEDYLDEDAYEAEYNEWLAKEPDKDNYRFAFDNSDSAKEAFDTDHENWVNNAPVRSDYLDEGLYEAAMNEYKETNPEPQKENYVYFEDGYTNEDVAKATYEADLKIWSDGKPVRETQEEYEAKLNQYVTDNPAPVLETYTAKVNNYASADEASAAYATEHSNWLGNKNTALDGLEEGSEEYETALANFNAANPEPQEKDFAYNEDWYNSVEDATSAYEEATAEWTKAKPVQETDEDYAAKVSQYESENKMPVEEDYTSKVNKYASKEEAATEYETAHGTWKENAPQEDAYIDDTLYENDVLDYEATEPQESDYLTKDDVEDDFVNKYDSKEAADSAYTEVYDSWLAEEPSEEDFADGYAEDYNAWVNEEPNLEDYEMDESEIPENADIIEAMG